MIYPNSRVVFNLYPMNILWISHFGVIQLPYPMNISIFLQIFPTRICWLVPRFFNGDSRRDASRDARWATSQWRVSPQRAHWRRGPVFLGRSPMGVTLVLGRFKHQKWWFHGVLPVIYWWLIPSGKPIYRLYSELENMYFRRKINELNGPVSLMVWVDSTSRRDGTTGKDVGWAEVVAFPGQTSWFNQERWG